MSLGYYFIKTGNPYAHRNCMISAMTSVGYIPFKGQGMVRPFYFTLLASHVILAALLAPMIAVTAFHAIKGNFDKHKRIARWTLPVWLYVSVTGVLIYFLVFHIYTS